MALNFEKSNKRDPARLEYQKPSHKAEIAFIIVGALIMLFPLFVDMGGVAIIISAEIIGFLFVLMGVVIVIDSEKKHKRTMRAITYGTEYKAVITRIQRRTRNVKRGSRRIRKHYYCAECEFISPDTNDKYLLTSSYVTYNLHGTEGKKVSVYMDPDDKTNYYVDLTTIFTEGQ